MSQTYDPFAAFRMTGHNVIITGGAQNIGAGIAKALAGAGANVMIADLQGDKAKETAARIETETGGRCMGMGCDVTKAADIDAVVAACVDNFGGVSTLVNNVGWGARHADPTAITQEALVDAEVAEIKSFEKEKYFEGCMPIEVMAARGFKTMLFGPM